MSYYILGDIKKDQPNSMYGIMEKEVIKKIIPTLVSFMPDEESKRIFKNNLTKGLTGLSINTVRDVLTKKIFP